ncbi:DUF1189 family protein [Lysinibacillus sp. KU-BSD001]|uniref:DUF1189 family protein n=1 Tax=Lysinibacillus sp. KU-BSD001 TaxID=3141328 RepID=UPI0036EF4934
MKHSQLFIDSLINPKKLAAYRILSIGKVIQYVFILITLITAFSFGQFTTGVNENVLNIDGLTEYIADIQWLLYPFAFIFLFIFTTLLIFARISLYALAGYFFSKIMKRRGEYRHIWRTAAFAATWAILISILSEMFQLSGTWTTLIGIFITMLFIIIALTKYPKQS